VRPVSESYTRSNRTLLHKHTIDREPPTFGVVKVHGNCFHPCIVRVTRIVHVSRVYLRKIPWQEATTSRKRLRSQSQVLLWCTMTGPIQRKHNRLRVFQSRLCGFARWAWRFSDSNTDFTLLKVAWCKPGSVTTCRRHYSGLLISARSVFLCSIQTASIRSALVKLHFFVNRPFAGAVSLNDEGCKGGTRSAVISLCVSRPIITPTTPHLKLE